MATADNLYQRAIELSTPQEQDENFLEIGAILRKLNEKDGELFQKYLEKAGIKRRKAYYLIEIDKALEGRKLPKARLKKLGWSKVLILSQHLDKFNGPDLLDQAEKYNNQELRAFLSGDKPQNHAHCVLMYFSPKDYKLFGQAVQKHGAKRSGRGFSDKEKALVKILKKAVEADVVS